MKFVFTTIISLFLLYSYSQTNTLNKKVEQLFAQQKVEEAQTLIVAQLNQAHQQKLYHQLNTIFPLYISSIKEYKNKETYDKAIFSYKKIIQQAFYTHLHDSLKAQNLMEYGLTLSKKQQYFEALEVYKEIQDKYPSVLQNDIPFKSLIYIETSWCYSYLGNQKNEIEFVQKAIDLMEANFSKIKERDFIVAYNNIFYYLNEYDDSEGQLRILKKFGSYFQSRYKTKTNTSEYYYAKRVYRKMQIIGARIEDKPELSYEYLKLMKQEMLQAPKIEFADDMNYYLSCLSDLCYYYNYSSKDYTTGLKLCNEYLQEATTQKDAFSIMLAHSILANQYREMKQYEKALFHVNASLNSYQFPPTSLSKFGLETMKALNLSSTAQHSSAIAIMENNIASIIQEHTNKKISILQINAQELKELNNSRYINIFATSSLIFLDAYKKEKNITYLAKAEKLVEIAALMFGEFYKKGSYNTTLSNLQNKIIEAYLFIAIEKYATNFNQKKKILQVIESNASFHLAKEFEDKLLRNNPSIGSLLNEETLLQQQKEFWAAQQVEKGNKENYSIKIKAIEQKLATIQQQIAVAKKGFTNLTLANFSVDACLKLLNKNEAIIKYYVATNNVYSVNFTKNNIHVKLLSTSEKLETISKNYLLALKQIQPSYQQLSNQLYTALSNNIEQKNITIIPDNYLNYLPFESLQNPVTKDFLVQQVNISYNYSLSLWYLHQINKSSTQSINLAAFAPNYNNVLYDSTRLNNLPFAKQEANYIAQLFKGKEFVGDVATKNNFFANQKQFDVVHCSMHSVLYDNDFNKSCLLFNNAQPLYFREMYTTSFPAEMIVLSACNTGAGKLIAGEGMMSLSKAFTYAGVKSTVVSLWQVPDKETSDLMILYYQYLKKGNSKSEALAQAKKDFIKNNPLKSHPYYWSGFILTGNDEPIVNNYSWLYYILGSLGLLLIGFFIFRKKKKSY